MPGRKVELATDEIDLAPLRDLEAVVGVGEDRAGIGHRGSQDHLVEAVRDVVVVRDGVAVAPARVQCATLAGLDARRGQGAKRLRADQAQELAGVGRREELAQGRDLEVEEGVEVPVEVDVARDEGPHQSELPGPAQHADQGVGGEDLEGDLAGRGVRRGRDDATVEGLDAKGRSTAEELGDHRRHGHG